MLYAELSSGSLGFDRSSYLLTSSKHGQSVESPILGLKSLKQRRQRQDVDQRMEETRMYERKGIQAIH